MLSSSPQDLNLLNTLIYNASTTVAKLIFAAASLRKLQSNPKPIIGIFSIFFLFNSLLAKLNFTSTNCKKPWNVECH